jgi:DNA-binding CsgD family transcriptional regulator
MSKIFVNTILLVFLVISSGFKPVSDTLGYIRGTILIDSTWERNIYVSYIETIEKKYTVSENLIIASSKVDSLGKFEIRLDKLASEWTLLRLHVVKRGFSKASIIIGSTDENYCFVIANRYSKIELNNTLEKSIFKNLSISGASYMNTFKYITNLSNYSNSISYENSLVEKKFIEEVISEKLKLIADTCQNSLVSLYALYLTDFNSDYQKNSTFYKAYLSKWRNDNTPYFKSFRRQFHVPEKRWKYISIIFIIGIFSFVSFFIYFKIKRKKRKLSVQERKVFELLQKGASNQEISDEFNIEISTVKSHVSSIFSKLNIKSRKEAINLRIK